jgi:hypothetical protein
LRPQTSSARRATFSRWSSSKKQNPKWTNGTQIQNGRAQHAPGECFNFFYECNLKNGR